VIIHIDTSALVDALTGPRRSLDTLIGLVEAEHRINISAPVLYEWLRGPRTRADLRIQEELMPSENVAVFGAVEAQLAARLYAAVTRPRGREIDLAVAACALANGAALWTLNRRDFQDIEALRLI
jgi:predicted nucleic acid-binding protein